jgi:polysaccharide pyruvyl transferase WcaK-like protein
VGNLGNDGSLQAMLQHLRRFVPDAEFTCICSGPPGVAATYNIRAIPSRAFLVSGWVPRGSLASLARKVILGVCGEPFQWLRSLRALHGMDAFIVPGTGILHDAAAFLSWGPYDLFRWSVAAKVCRCRLLFVSMGAGPLHTRVGRWLIKRALSLADFRSYRDESTRKLLEELWGPAGRDSVYPDLAFSLATEPALPDRSSATTRQVVAIGLMGASGRYSEGASSVRYARYLDTLVEFAEWLLAHDYDVRILYGDTMDVPAAARFVSLLETRSPLYDAVRVINEPITSVEGLMMQLASVDLVVATRFHNVLLALLLNKPAIAITFHDKCTSLMQQMGLSRFSHDINRMDRDGLIEQFSLLSREAGNLEVTIEERVKSCRQLLDEQYALVHTEISRRLGTRSA